MTAFKKCASVAALFVMFGSAQADTVLCPGALGGGLTRQVQVTGALSGGECYYKTGNFQGDDVSTYLGNSYSLIEKDIAPNGGGGGSLQYTGSTSGTWSMGSNLWTTYDEIFIGFHFGNGSGDPDSFLVELDPGNRSAATSGLWALIPTSLANGLSNIYLFGRGTPPANGNGNGGANGNGNGNNVPEPATLALAGLSLLGLAAARRRRSA